MFPLHSLPLEMRELIYRCVLDEMLRTVEHPYNDQPDWRSSAADFLSLLLVDRATSFEVKRVWEKEFAAHFVFYVEDVCTLYDLRELARTNQFTASARFSLRCRDDDVKYITQRQADIERFGSTISSARLVPSNHVGQAAVRRASSRLSPDTLVLRMSLWDHNKDIMRLIGAQYGRDRDPIGIARFLIAPGSECSACPDRLLSYSFPYGTLYSSHIHFPKVAKHETCATKKGEGVQSYKEGMAPLQNSLRVRCFSWKPGTSEIEWLSNNNFTEDPKSLGCAVLEGKICDIKFKMGFDVNQARYALAHSRRDRRLASSSAWVDEEDDVQFIKDMSGPGIIIDTLINGRQSHDRGQYTPH